MRLKIIVLLAALLALVLTSSASADLRTKGIRLVPEKVWEASPGPISISSEAKAEHEKVPELIGHMDGWVAKGFTKLKYEVTDDASLEFHYTIDEFDPGSQAKRLALGFGGSAYVKGTVIIRQDGEEVGRYQYSAKPRGGLSAGSLKSMGKEVGPPLVLKITNGESDEELHPKGGEEEEKD